LELFLPGAEELLGVWAEILLAVPVPAEAL
jgi:hypothetical protein